MLKDNQITQLIDGFVRAGRKVGLKVQDGYEIVLKRYDEGWRLELASAGKKGEGEIKRWGCPGDLPDDELGSAIALAAYLSIKLHDYNRSIPAAQGRRAHQASLTPEERSARAKKAVEARIKKYGQNKRK